MVEVEFLHLGADSVWDVGWRVHLLPHQHPGSGHLPPNGLDCGEWFICVDISVESMEREREREREKERERERD